jgi:hypothetical protein
MASAGAAGALKWQYIDDDGVTQGPFEAEAMTEWFKEGFFSAETQVRIAHAAERLARCPLAVGTAGPAPPCCPAGNDRAPTH